MFIINFRWARDDKGGLSSIHALPIYVHVGDTGLLYITTYEIVYYNYVTRIKMIILASDCVVKHWKKNIKIMFANGWAISLASFYNRNVLQFR